MTERASPYAIVPVEAAQDHRLTAMQYRVLLAILSFRNKNSDTCFPRREKIAARCGYSITNVSRVTAQLVELGWLQKEGRGGRSSPTHYRVTVPETVADPETVATPETVAGSETVAESATVANPDSKTVAGSVTKTVAGSATGKEQTNEQTNEQTRARRGCRFDEFWNAWPSGHKVARKACRDKWKRKKLDAMADTIISDVLDRQRRDKKWVAGYIPNPLTYLNQDRWEDDIQHTGQAPEKNKGDLNDASPV